MIKMFLKLIDRYGVLLIVFFLPAYLFRFRILGIPSTFLEVLFSLVFIVWVFNNFTGLKERIKLEIKKEDKKYIVKNYPFSFFIISLVLASFISLLVTGFSNNALGVYKAYFIEAILFYVLIFNYSRGKGNIEKIILSLASSAFLVSLFAVYQKVTGHYWSGGVDELRVTSVFLYPNALGLYLGPLAVLFYFYGISLFTKKDKQPYTKLKAIYIFLAFILSLFAIIFARSEASLLALLFSVFFGSIFISKRFAYFYVFLGFIIGGIILHTPTLKVFVFEKAQLKDFSGEVRKQQWRETRELLKSPKRFIFGCGLSSYQECIQDYHQDGIFFNAERDPDFRRKIVIYNDEYREKHWRPTEIYMYPHNIVLNFWVELGLLGLLSFFGLIVQFFYFALTLLKSRKGKEEKIIILGLLFAVLEILIHGLVDVPYFKNDLSFLFWVFFGIMGAYWVSLKNSDEK